MQEIIAAAEAVIAAVDQTALAKHLARKTPEEGPGAAERKKRADEQKGALVEALEKKASALLELNPTAPGDAPAESPDASYVQVRFHALAKCLAPTMAQEPAFLGVNALQGALTSVDPADNLFTVNSPTPMQCYAMQGAGEAGEFEQAFRELQAWTDTTEDKPALLHARFQYRQGRYASAIKCVLLPIILHVSELSSAPAYI